MNHLCAFPLNYHTELFFILLIFQISLISQNILLGFLLIINYKCQNFRGLQILFFIAKNGQGTLMWSPNKLQTQIKLPQLFDSSFIKFIPKVFNTKGLKTRHYAIKQSDSENNN
ncbi:hypothetical protein pb186bvf_020134 [Paramecium bursaria]